MNANTEIVIKSQETKEGVRFRLLKEGKYFFADIKFNNYFYVKTHDYESYKDEFYQQFTFCIEKGEPIGQFTKISFSYNFMRQKVRKWWEEKDCATYEADIKANKRFLLDKPLTLNNELIPYAFFDIETDDRKPLVKDEQGNVVPQEDARVLCWGITDYQGKQIYSVLLEDTDSAERGLLNDFLKAVAEYGIISGWNSEGFDMPYIKGRCDKLGISYEILEYINHVDYLELFKKYDKKSRGSFKLDAIAYEVLKKHKIEQEKGHGKIYNTWLNDREHLLKYNIEDSNLVYLINDDRRFIEVSMKRADRAGCHVRNTVNNSDSGDFLLMREYKKDNIIMPSKPNEGQVWQRKKSGKIGGGYTTCFEPGYHENVTVGDFKSEYPSVIQAWNISPETYIQTVYKEEDLVNYPTDKFVITPKDQEGEVFHPHRVYLRKEGIFPRVLKNLINARDKLRKSEEFKNLKKTLAETDFKKHPMYLEQYAIKTDANSLYGVLSHVYSRYYSWEVGDSVTSCARATIKQCYEHVKTWGCEVLGGDTDSGFFLLKGMSRQEFNDKFKAFLNEWMDKWQVVSRVLEFIYDDVWDGMFFVKKKHYGYIHKGDIFIKGLEAIKSDTNMLAAKLQRQFIEDVLRKLYDPGKWELFIEQEYTRCFNQELTTKELILVKALSKMPQEYEGDIIDKKTGKPKIKNDGTIQKKTIPAHVKLAKRMISQGIDIYPGSKIPYIVVLNKPILALSPEEYESKTGSYSYKSKKYGEIMHQYSGGYEAKYYWTRLMKPLIKVIFTYYKGVLPNWSWGLNTSDMNKMLKSLDSNDEDEEIE